MKLTTGVYSAAQVPMADYLADPCPAPSLSNGIVRRLAERTPAHAWQDHPKLNPAWRLEHKDDFDLGSACHDVLLGDGSTIEVLDYPDFKTKDARAHRDDARERGKVPLLRHRYEQIGPIVDIARRHLSETRILRAVWDVEHFEETVIWMEGDAWARGRPDIWSGFDEEPAVIHYKTTKVSAGNYQRTFCGLGYDITAAWYERGCGGRQIFLVQEMQPPYLCVAYEPTEGMMHMARRKVEFAIDLWRKCIETEAWPGYPSAIQWIEATPWSETEWIEREQAGQTTPEAINEYLEAFAP